MKQKTFKIGDIFITQELDNGTAMVGIKLKHSKYYCHNFYFDNNWKVIYCGTQMLAGDDYVF